MKKYIFTHKTMDGIRIEIDARTNDHAWDKLSAITTFVTFCSMELQEIIIPKESENEK